MKSTLLEEGRSSFVIASGVSTVEAVEKDRRKLGESCRLKRVGTSWPCIWWASHVWPFVTAGWDALKAVDRLADETVGNEPGGVTFRGYRR